MARFVKLTRKTNKEIQVNPEFIAAFEISETKGCCTLRFSDGNTVEIKADVEELARLMA